MTKDSTLLILSPRFPYPLEKGDKLRLYNQICGLKNHFNIILVSLSEKSILKKHLTHIETLVNEVHIIQQSKFRNVKAVMNSVIQNKSIQEAYYYETNIQNQIDKIITETNPDLIFVQLVRVAEYVIHKNVPKFIDFMDAMSLNMERESSKHGFLKKFIYNREANLLKKSEVKYAEIFNKSSIISVTDYNVLKGYGIENLSIISNGVDFEYFNRNNISKVAEKYKLVFVGNMGYLPNIEAASYLVHNIHTPYFSTEKILISGARPHHKVLQLKSKNVEVSGWVSDIRESYLAGKIVIAPIFTGSGQQNKILEAMALGKVCITTDIVSNAIQAEDMKNILVANTPEEFKSKIELITSNNELKNRIEKNARIFVEQNYMWQNQVNKLVKELKQLIKE